MSCKRRYRPIVCVTQRSSLQSNHIPFPLCLWSNQQTNHVRETWLYVSRRARTLLNFRHINQSPLALCLQATKRLILLKFVLSGYQISKWKKKVWWAYKTLTRIGCFFLTFVFSSNFRHKKQLLTLTSNFWKSLFVVTICMQVVPDWKYFLFNSTWRGFRNNLRELSLSLM